MKEYNINSASAFSEFRILFKAILTTRDFLTQKIWAQLLLLSQPGLSQWLKPKDYTFPSSEKLLRFIRVLSKKSSKREDISELYKRLLITIDIELPEKDRQKVKNQSTIGNYCLSDLRSNLDSSLTNLPFSIQHELILTIMRIISECSRNIENITAREKTLEKLRYLDLSFIGDSESKRKLGKLKLNDVDENKLQNEFMHLPFKSLNAAKELSYQFSKVNVEKQIFKSSKYFLPLDSHLYRIEESKEEYMLYTSCLNHFNGNNEKIEDRIELVDHFYKSFMNDEIRDVFPGLLFSLVQSLFVKDFESSELSVDRMLDIRTKMLKIYIKGFETDLFSPERISINFYKRVLELAGCHREFKFANKFSKKIEIIVINGNSENAKKLYGQCNLYSHMLNIPKLKSTYKVFKLINYQTVDIDLIFFKLRSELLLKEYSQEIEKTINGLKSRLENELYLGNEEKSSKYWIRLSAYLSLINSLSRKEKVVNIDEATLDKVDDMKWMENCKSHWGLDLVLS